MVEPAVIGREEELRSLRGFLASLEHGSAAVVLSGEAGIGKTILWEKGAAEARERFGRILVHRSVEAEATLSFAGLSDLLVPVFSEVAPALAPVRRRALEVALLLAEPGEATSDERAVGLALLDVLRALAERSPLLVALDDVQWLDPATADVLQIALRRLTEERVGLLATIRTGADVAARFGLVHAFAEERLDRLAVGPLSLGALHHLLKERVSLELTRPELVRVHETSAGNPFLALELARELVRTNTRPAAGVALRVPQNLQELLGGRLARLPTDAGDVVLFAAALARPTVELVATAHGHRESVLEAIDAAVREGVVELDDARLRFAHPLLASICYEQAPPWKRRAVHRALAGAVTEVEERARHMALSVDGPDIVASSYLDAAADHAAARGAAAAAAELAELAAELTPDDPALERKRRVRAASLHRLAGNGDRAAAALEELLPDVPAGLERADVLFELVKTLSADTPTLLEYSEEALVEAEGDDARTARILAYRTGVYFFRADGRAALADARAALAYAERVGDPGLLVEAIGRVGQAESFVGEVTEGLLERGVEIEESHELACEYWGSPRYALARLYVRRGELDRARALFEELDAAAMARGDEVSRTMILWPLSMLEWLAGRWSHAVECAASARELTEQTLNAHARAWMGRARALLETDLGLVEEARASAETGLAFAQETSNEFYTIVSLGSLGRLELALGNLAGAADYLRDLPRRLLAAGLNDPTTPIWADAIETLVSVGELERARADLEKYEHHAEKLRSPWSVEGARRCRGLFAAAEGDAHAALETLERLVTDSPDPPWPFERARTVLSLGTVRRQAQQKRAAREALEQALAVFEELGASLWAEKARAELKRISGRRAPTEELTATEERVAELAAQGRANKEIASELFMGVSTVEAHLSRVYRKLGIRSRTELAGRLVTLRAEGVTPVDDPAQA
jgi:DNA-binding CsgD family transcriptional regulator